MILLIKLLLAHFAGDFIFQPHSWVREKELKKHRSLKLYFHVLIHGALIFLLVGDPGFWLPVLVIVITHYLIDLAKVAFQKTHNKGSWFLADQLLHLLVIGIVWYGVDDTRLIVNTQQAEGILIIFTAALFLTNPASVIIRMVISQWTPDTLHSVNGSLPDAGKFIGFLERLMVLAFILLDHWEAVGFLLAAKSVFRFGNLKESHDRKLTEYVLIGTLLSFAIAIAVALCTSALISLLGP